MSQNEVIYEYRTKINVLKNKLYDTDYKAIKYAEGLLSEEEYAPIKEQRQTWRNEINTLEEELKELQEGTNEKNTNN